MIRRNVYNDTCRRNRNNNKRKIYVKKKYIRLMLLRLYTIRVKRVKIQRDLVSVEEKTFWDRTY